MPIRMVKDPGNDKPRKSRRSSSANSSAGRGSGMAGGLGSLVSVVLPYLIKRPKLLFPLLILAFVNVKNNYKN